MQIGDFYLDREEYQSAASRYRAVLDQYPGLGLDPEALYKLAVCYEAMNLTDEATQIFQVILDNYKDTEVADLFRKAQADSRKGAELGKDLLRARLSGG